jgi:Ulp1 family protease
MYLHDLLLLNPPNWFNDNIITFCCDYMQHILFHDDKSIKFVYPATSFVLMYEDEDEILKDLFQSNGITKDKSLIFFPIIDSEPNQHSGSHWSFVLFSSMDQKYYVFDSARHHGNEMYARNLIKIAAKFLSTKFCPDKDIVTIRSPLQTNNYDCGCYMVMTMKILTWLLMSGSKIDDTLYEQLALYINESSVTEERNVIKKNIFEIRNKLLLGSI